jgi:hypothetical protein
VAPVNLIELAKQNPEAVADYTIQQIVGICGDGNLRDNSTCSAQLREYLALQTSSRLSAYAHFCLEDGFTNSGFVLQDIINEVGRRLGYEVQNGRYRGVSNQSGFDGLWLVRERPRRGGARVSAASKLHSGLRGFGLGVAGRLVAAAFLRFSIRWS